MPEVTKQDPVEIVQMPGDPLSKVADVATKKAAECFDLLFKPGIAQVGGMLEDYLAHWRGRMKVGLLLKTQKFLEAKGLRPQPVSAKILFPLLEAGSLEEDEEMQNKWASMLANAADPSSGANVRPRYPEILKQLSPLEVKMLDKYYEEIKDKPENELVSNGIMKEKAMTAFGITPQEFDIISENLFSLGLCQTPSSVGGVTIGPAPIVLRTNVYIQLTPLGRDFVRACKY